MGIKLIRLIHQNFLSYQFVVFLGVGVLGALLHWTFRYFLNEFIDYSLALIAAYGLSLFSGFLLSKYLVFPASKKSTLHQAIYFFTFNILMFPVVYGISYTLSEYIFYDVFSLNIARGLSHAIAVGIPAIINFLFQKFIVFDG